MIVVSGGMGVLAGERERNAVAPTAEDQDGIPLSRSGSIVVIDAFGSAG
jgi:hypothetical protein